MATNQNPNQRQPLRNTASLAAEIGGSRLGGVGHGGGGHGGGGHGGGGHGGGGHGGGFHMIGNFSDGGLGPALLVARQSALYEPASNPGRKIVTMGWHPDVPDVRDLTVKHDLVARKLAENKSLILTKGKIGVSADHRGLCSPIEDQGNLGSCTAQAVVGLMEYMMRKADIEHIDGSRLFVYKVTRKLLGWTGDNGAYLRTAVQAVAAFGIPPEKHWPYDIDRYEEEPSPFLYSYAANYKALNYTRLDPSGASPDEILTLVKRVLAAGYCIVFGFSVYRSMSHLPDIPFPHAKDRLDGGHAVMAVGYDDNHIVERGDKKVAVPSLIIRNSWGADWGEEGYGYLPYDYVLTGLARDFWTAFKWDWIDTGKFS